MLPERPLRSSTVEVVYHFLPMTLGSDLATASAHQSDPAGAPAGIAWGALLEFLRLLRPRYARAAGRFELSPMQAFTLTHLRPGAPLAMNELAGALACDASNVTGIVDRLEARGLVERRVSPLDRRVKMLAVTTKGVRLRSRLLDRLHEPPPEIAELTPADQQALADVLQRALARHAVDRA